MSEVLPLVDLTPALWLVGEIGVPAPTVGHLLPRGYAAHVEVADIQGALQIRDVLEGWTTTPEQAYVCWWDGFGGLWSSAPRLHLPYRDHVVFETALPDLERLVETFGQIGYAEPSLWWPADRAWVVQWEVDCDATYVACSREAGDALLASGLPCRDVDRDDPVVPG